MKSSFTGLSLVALVAASMTFSEAQAITSPATVTDFTTDGVEQTLIVHASGWSDPAFGDMGWTHRSAWAKFTAQKDQTVVIKAMSDNTDVHPGISVWYRSEKDTIDDKYVYDHFYAQMANQFKSKAVDEATQAPLGNLVMKNVAYGYDMDGNKRLPRLHGARDGVAGEYTLKFRAPQTGTYMFVLGGVNPGKSLFTDGTLTTLTDTAAKLPVDVSVTVSQP